jgi:TIR domain
MQDRIEVFLSYAHEDEQLAQELARQLGILQLQGLITVWHRQKIAPGQERTHEITRHLDSAQIILLLISPYFLTSTSCYRVEMKQALERHKAGNARVIPIILRPTDWRGEPFSKLQVLPRNGKPLTKWSNRDLAFFDIVTGIQQAVEELTTTLYTSANSPMSQQTLPNLETPDGNKLKELANEVRKTYSIIRGYEDIIRISDDPRGKAQALQSIEKQGILARYFLNEYLKLADQMDVRIPSDLIQISAYFGDMEYRAIS